MEKKLQPQAKPQPPQAPPKQPPPKHHHENFFNITKPPNNNNNNNDTKFDKSNKPIWDCGSTLYDSFELDSFQKQLNSAIINSSRTLSMPRLPSQDHRAPPPKPPSKKSKFSRSFQKLLRSVFKAHKPNTDKPSSDSGSSSPDPWFLDQEEENNMKVVDSGRYFVVFEKPNGLSSIPEVPELGLSPEIGSLVRKTMSDRFSFKPNASSDGIYCA